MASEPAEEGWRVSDLLVRSSGKRLFGHQT